jgi:hypothetical protein
MALSTRIASVATLWAEKTTIQWAAENDSDCDEPVALSILLIAPQFAPSKSINATVIQRK